MVKLILGMKGTGKTKQLVSAINEAVKTEAGSMVCIETGKHLTYDIDYRVRLIDAKEYGICSDTLLKGFVSGLHAGNFDITHVFIESLYKIIGTDLDLAVSFCKWCQEFGKANDMKFTITVSEDPENLPEELKDLV